MTTEQYSKLLSFYKSKLAVNLNENDVIEGYKSAVLERDRQKLNSISTSDTDEYIVELEKLIQL